MNDLILHRGLIMTQPDINGGYIDCVYKITTTSDPTKLLGFNVGQMSMIRSMEIDGISTQPVSEYVFNTMGEHNIRFYINYIFSALNMFKDCITLVSIIFNTNTDIKINMSNIANGCTNLQNVLFKDNMKIKDLERSFLSCASLDTVDLTNVVYNNLPYTFYGASVRNIIFGDIDSVFLLGTFFILNNKEATIDLTKIKKISRYSQPFDSAVQPKLIDFGKCDLSSCIVTQNCFFGFNSPNENAKTIMLGEPMLYPNPISILDKMLGDFIYNLEYDFSPIFYEHPNLIPKANKSVNKTLKIRFCNNNQWITDPSSNFIINDVVGKYTSQGIWEFSMNADTYKYPILHNGVEIGEVIVKDDIQQIAFGSNNEVYKVLDFSSKNLINPEIITDIEGGEWGWPEDMLSLKDLTGDSSYWKDLDTLYFRNGYLGYTHKRVNINETTSVTINTGMLGEVIITTALDSQMNFYHGKLYDSNNKLLINMSGSVYKTYEAKFKVTTNDGIVKFTYSKIYTGNNIPDSIGLDRMFIKKIENYNWPLIPE